MFHSITLRSAAVGCAIVLGTFPLLRAEEGPSVDLGATVHPAATTITITNASFEDEVLPLGGRGGLPGWIAACFVLPPAICHGPVSLHPTAADFDGSGSSSEPAIGIPDGVNVAFTTSLHRFGPGPVEQWISKTLVGVPLNIGSTYAISAWTGSPHGLSAGIPKIELLAGGQTVASLTSTPLSGHFQKMTMTHTATEDDPGLGEDIQIRLSSIPPSSRPPNDIGNAAWDLVAVEVKPPTIPIVVDIKPGSDPNSINCRHNGIIPVAILTTSTAMGDPVGFDATVVDTSTVGFGPTAAMHFHRRPHTEDVDGDGDMDMVLHFRQGSTGIRCGDGEACLRGQTTDGTPIQGCDAIRTVGARRKR